MGEKEKWETLIGETEEILEEIEAVQEGHQEEDQENLEKNIKLRVLSAGRNVQFHSSQQKEDQFSVVNAGKQRDHQEESFKLL